MVKPELSLFLVADGMGGTASGDLASNIFAETAIEIFSKSEPTSEQERLETLQRTFALANTRIQDIVRRNPHNLGMGCTAEVLTFFHKSCLLGHVGDSRTYLFRENEFKQLTKDHSIVQDQIDKGLISSSDARNHHLRHAILRAVGVEEKLAVDLVKGSTLPGDIFLLCSDGLTNMVDEISIAQVLASKLSLTDKVDKLIELANSAGGHDNVTVILCEVGHFDAAQP